MAKITNLAEFTEYTYKMLGSGVITVELSPDQIEEIVMESVDDFNRYMYGEGAQSTYMAFDLSAGVSEYSLSGTNVSDVCDMLLSFEGQNGGVNTLFTAQNFLFNPATFGSASTAMFASFLPYDMAMNYLAEINLRFQIKYRLDYIQGKELLRIVPTPTSDKTAMLEVYTKEEAINLYNHPLLKKLVVARSKILWGTILGKYSMSLPGGGSINGSEIKSDGITEEEKVMERIYKEGETTESIFMVG